MKNARNLLLVSALVMVVGSCQNSRMDLPDPIIVEVDSGGNHIMGSESAPVVIIAFSDFECTYCQEFFKLIENVKSDYIENGKVKYIYRDFPLEKHEQAFLSAACANCAGEQGKYWEMYKILFENQEDLSDQNYQKWAMDLELDLDSFKECMSSENTRKEIEDDYAKGEEIGVGGTPTFIINNEMYGGVPPENIFRQMLDSSIQRSAQNQ